MKSKLPKTILALFGSALLIPILLSQNAYAVPINGSIVFGGGTATGSQTGGTSTLTFNDPRTVVSRTGDYFDVPVGTSVNWAPISWMSSGNTAVLTPGPQLEWQFTVNGTTYSFTLFALQSATMNSSMVSVSGTGILQMSGVFNRDPTLGTFAMQGTGSNFLFALAPAVPETGSALTLLAFASCGLELLRRKLRAA